MVKNCPRLHPWATHWPINANQVPCRRERDYDLSRSEMERWYQLSAFNQYWLILIGIDCIKTFVPNRRCDYVMGGHDILLKTMSLAVYRLEEILILLCHVTELCHSFVVIFLIYDICVVWWLLVTSEQLSDCNMLTEVCLLWSNCMFSQWMVFSYHQLSSFGKNPVLFKG